MSDIGLTANLNERSIDSIRYAISKKISANPYFANNKTVTNTITDMDHHPYTRSFRGVYYYPDPIVLEREAGYRKMNDLCYEIVSTKKPDVLPEHCFETACTTILPCRPSYLVKYADKDKLEVMLNRSCISEFR